MKQYVDDWLRKYADERLREGAVQAEVFSVYYDPLANQLLVNDGWQIQSHTVTFLVEEMVCWQLAARRETVYTAYQKGLDLRVIGEFKIRDMELVDEILDLFYTALLENGGEDLAMLFQQMGG